jgi:hypothetical protein
MRVKLTIDKFIRQEQRATISVYQSNCSAPSSISLPVLILGVLLKSLTIVEIRQSRGILPPVPIFPQVTPAMVDPLFQVMSVLPICETQT